jgi:hypothetical protein
MDTGRTNEALWERMKAKAVKQMGGGWSARAAQLAGRLYREAGGGYTSKRTPAQRSLTDWTKQDWRTKSGKPSRITGERYLPAKAIEALTASEYTETSRLKRAGMEAGVKYVPQPKAIAMKVKAFRK